MANDPADLILGIVATIGTRGLLVDELAVFLPEGIPVLLHTVGCFLRQQWVLLTREAPSSAIDQMPMEAIELITGHLIEEP